MVHVFACVGWSGLFQSSIQFWSSLCRRLWSDRRLDWSFMAEFQMESLPCYCSVFILIPTSVSGVDLILLYVCWLTCWNTGVESVQCPFLEGSVCQSGKEEVKSVTSMTGVIVLSSFSASTLLIGNRKNVWPLRNLFQFSSKTLLWWWIQSKLE